MATIPCPPDEVLRTLALAGDGPDDVKRHLEVCAGCRVRLARLAADVRHLGDGPSAPDAQRSTVSDPRLTAGNTETIAGATPDRPPPEEPRPATIGKYLIVGQLGRGGQGVVYRAVHADLHLDAVIKLARKPLDPTGARQNRFLEEGRILARLRHENLIDVYDVGVHEGRPFLAMQLVSGCTLEQHAGQRRYTPNEAAAVVAAVARAVAYLNGRGVVHQDINPRNIMIDQPGRPRLIDFGLARLRDVWSDDAAGPVGGTPGYMAPEQARGEVERVGPAADVFSLGGTLYFLLTGHAPNGDGTRGEILKRARHGLADHDALSAPGIPRRLARIARKALAADPSARPSAGELAAELDRFTRRIPRRVALVIPLVAAGAWWASRGRDSPVGPVAPNPFRAGSTWAGTFFWTTDLKEARHSVRLKVTDRQGDGFSGVYETEDGRYAFRVVGTVRGDAVRWVLREQLRGEPGDSIVDRAKVEGTIKDGRIDARYSEKGGDVALMELRLVRPD